eukprot:1291839-Amphidinium_carterae.1
MQMAGDGHLPEHPQLRQPHHFIQVSSSQRRCVPPILTWHVLGPGAPHSCYCCLVRAKDGDDGTECQLGALEWSIVVLDELTVGLEVRAEISAPDGSTSVRFVQENGASAQKFQGTFNPAERFAEAFEENRLDAIVFELDNTF